MPRLIGLLGAGQVVLRVVFEQYVLLSVVPGRRVNASERQCWWYYARAGTPPGTGSGRLPSFATEDAEAA
jgi:hypothetical protein